MIMDKFLLLLFILSMSSCASYKKGSLNNFFGVYIHRDKSKVEVIHLRKDSLFEYRSFHHNMNVIGDTLTGNINMGNEKIIISSLYQPKTMRLVLECINHTESDILELFVRDSGNNPIIGADCVAYYKSSVVGENVLNHKGYCKFEATAIDEIIVNYTGYENIVISAIPDYSGILEIDVNEKINSIYFKDGIIEIIRKNKIILITDNGIKEFRKYKTKGVQPETIF